MLLDGRKLQNILTAETNCVKRNIYNARSALIMSMSWTVTECFILSKLDKQVEITSVPSTLVL